MHTDKNRNVGLAGQIAHGPRLEFRLQAGARLPALGRVNAGLQTKRHAPVLFHPG
jgi:hypothetical protein